MAYRILIVDDDEHIGNLLEEVLQKEGYAVLRAYSGTEALLLLASCQPDVALLDLMLPGLSGEEILPRMRGIPVIVLSAKAEMDDKVNLLLGGAADYMTKPFDTKELLARIAVQLRGDLATRAGARLVCGDLNLETETHRVTAGGIPVRLTKTEFALLKLLMQHPKLVMTKSRIIDLISDDTQDGVDSSLKVHVSNLRGKLRAATGKDYIEAVWGVGFKLREF